MWWKLLEKLTLREDCILQNFLNKTNGKSIVVEFCYIDECWLSTELGFDYSSHTSKPTSYKIYKKNL